MTSNTFNANEELDYSSFFIRIFEVMAEMDRIVQRIAANAEEMAGTSEEMNAQARYMNAFISNLVTIVGKPGESGETKKEFQVSERDAELRIFPQLRVTHENETPIGKERYT